MACGFLTPATTRHLSTNLSGANSVVHEAFTDWIPVMGLDSVRALLRFAALTNQFQGQLAYQTAATRTDQPDAWGVLDQVTSTDRCTGSISLSGVTANKFYIRFGIAYNLSSGSTNSQADVSLQLSYSICGSLVGTATLQALAPDTSNYFAPVTGWMPAADAAKVLAALLVSGVVGNFQCRLTYRTAQLETAVVTDNWATINLEAGWHTGNGSFNTGQLTLPTSGNGRTDDKMWIQFGLQFSVSSGTGGQATVSVATAVRS